MGSEMESTLRGDKDLHNYKHRVCSHLSRRAGRVIFLCSFSHFHFKAIMSDSNIRLMYRYKMPLPLNKQNAVYSASLGIVMSILHRPFHVNARKHVRRNRCCPKKEKKKLQSPAMMKANEEVVKRAKQLCFTWTWPTSRPGRAWPGQP